MDLSHTISGNLSYNLHSDRVKLSFSGRFFRVSALTLCHQGFISLQRFVLPLPLKGQVSTLIEISAIYMIDKYLLYSFYSVAFNTKGIPIRK